jgi:serine O-acetyltransferase
MKNLDQLREYIVADFSRLSNAKFSILKCIRYYITNASFKITLLHRIGNYFKNKGSLGRIPFVIIQILAKKNAYKTGIQLPFETKVGKGLVFPHFSCIVINSKAIIGDYCTIFQGCTIGSVRGKGSPIIGHHVVLASGAKIIGDVQIGNYAFIGANTFVNKDVPDNAVAGGVPAKIINMNGKLNTQLYL